VQVTLQTPGSKAVLYGLEGGSSIYLDFDGRSVHNVTLAPGTVAVFQIYPQPDSASADRPALLSRTRVFVPGARAYFHSPNFHSLPALARYATLSGALLSLN
jgi:hypothetical protein